MMGVTAMINAEKLCALMASNAPDSDRRALEVLAVKLSEAPIAGFWCLENHPAFARYLEPIATLSKAGVVNSCYEVLGVPRVWLSLKTLSELSKGEVR